MSLHDVSDVLLNLAKVFKYTSHEILADVFFGIFAISFYLLRIGLYPRVLFSVLSDACTETVCTVVDDYRQCFSMPYLLLLILPLFVLQILQFLGGWKIAEAIYKKMFLGILEDDRE